MATDKIIKKDVKNLLTVNADAVDQALKNAVQDALCTNQRANNKVAVWRDDKVAVINADEAGFSLTFGQSRN